MHRRIRIGLALALFAALVCGWSLPAAAQTATPSYKYQFTPYIWLSGLQGTLGARGRTAEVDASISGVFDHIHFAMMGAFETRWDMWRLTVDTLYLDISDDKATPGILFNEADANAKMLIFDPEIGYRILKRERAELDVTAGVRYWHLKNELRLSGARVESVGVSHTGDWVDPIVGARFRWDISDRMYVISKADIGGFDAGAKIDWQAFGGVGLKFNERLSGTVGYRHMAVDYRKDGFVFDTAMKGIILGFGIHF